MHVILYIPRKNTHLLNRKGTDDSTENMPGISDGHQNIRITRIVSVKLG